MPGPQTQIYKGPLCEAKQDQFWALCTLPKRTFLAIASAVVKAFWEIFWLLQKYLRQHDFSRGWSMVSDNSLTYLWGIALKLHVIRSLRKRHPIWPLRWFSNIYVSFSSLFGEEIYTHFDELRIFFSFRAAWNRQPLWPTLRLYWRSLWCSGGFLQFATHGRWITRTKTESQSLHRHSCWNLDLKGFIHSH